MKHTTHMAGGVAAWAVVCAITTPAPVVLFAGAAIAAWAGPLPDIDNLGTWSRRKKARRRKAAWYAVRVMPNRKAHPVKYRVAWVVSRWGTHRRGPCHSLAGGALFASVAVLPLAWWPSWPLWAAGAVLAGWWSHLALDLANEDPVMLLWPWPRLFHGLPHPLRCRVGGLGELAWRAALIISAVVIGLHY